MLSLSVLLQPLLSSLLSLSLSSAVCATDAGLHVGLCTRMHNQHLTQCPWEPIQLRHLIHKLVFTHKLVLVFTHRLVTSPHNLLDTRLTQIWSTSLMQVDDFLFQIQICPSGKHVREMYTPLKPHFYTAILGYAGVYLFFLFFLQNIDCGYSLEPPCRGGSNVYPQSMF